MTVTATFTAADRFALTLDGLCRAVAARIAGGAMAAVMILLVWRRLRRIESQVLGLLARFRAGRLRVLTGARPGVVGARGGGPSALPRRFGWLLPLVPHEAACFASALQVVLAEQEMVALLEAAPQARRALRPLCRMLGLEAAVLVPGGGRGLDSAPGHGAEAPALPELQAPSPQYAAYGGAPPRATPPPETRVADASDRDGPGPDG